MSTYWSLYCETCNVLDTGDSANHGEMALAEAIKAFPAVKSLLAMDLMWVETPKVMGYSDPFLFLSQHDGHVVWPRSEYGDRGSFRGHLD